MSENEKKKFNRHRISKETSPHQHEAGPPGSRGLSCTIPTGELAKQVPHGDSKSPRQLEMLPAATSSSHSQRGQPPTLGRARRSRQAHPTWARGPRLTTGPTEAPGPPTWAHGTAWLRPGPEQALGLPRPQDAADHSDRWAPGRPPARPPHLSLGPATSPARWRGRKPEGGQDPCPPPTPRRFEADSGLRLSGGRDAAGRGNRAGAGTGPRAQPAPSRRGRPAPPPHLAGRRGARGGRRGRGGAGPEVRPWRSLP